MPFKPLPIGVDDFEEMIEMKNYEEDLVRDGYAKVLCYGIAFYKKNCRITLAERTII